VKSRPVSKLSRLRKEREKGVCSPSLKKAAEVDSIKGSQPVESRFAGEVHVGGVTSPDQTFRLDFQGKESIATPGLPDTIVAVGTG